MDSCCWLQRAIYCTVIRKRIIHCTEKEAIACQFSTDKLFESKTKMCSKFCMKRLFSLFFRRAGSEALSPVGSS